MTEKKAITLIRFKKDLRVQDNQALTDALNSWNPCFWVYCFEPSIMKQPDWSQFHGQFTKDSLIDLERSLKLLNVPLLTFHGEVLDIFDLLQKEYILSNIYAHEETWNWATYKRDISVIQYCKQHTISFHELPTNWVVRKLSNRDHRASLQKERIHMPVLSIPTAQKILPAVSQTIKKRILTLEKKILHSYLQQWWETKAHQRMHDFFSQERSSYLYNVWKPLESTFSCSRLSPYIAYGNLSIKQIYHEAITKKLSLKEHWIKRQRHLTALVSRLYWHCHFIQKLESEVTYETHNIHPMYDTLRTHQNTALINARKKWETGYPLIDAAMRCLHHTGRINFRLRATVVSFICNTCMQDRRHVAPYLAQLFTDYEPGIHYPQFQMQSWTTGINQYRIYNPTKQLLEKDPHGTFIDKRIPELHWLPMPLKAEPRKASWWLFENQYGVTLWRDYPFPCIDIEQANRTARTQLRDLKKQPWFRDIAQSIYLKHGSRKKR